MIARTNLLPWRQRRRDRQRRAFAAQLGVVFGACVCLVGLASVVLDGRIGRQDARNRFLVASIGELEQRTDEIERIRQRTEETLGRVQALSGLRHDRTGIARIFQELARTVVPGIHYTSLALRGTHISVQGIARTNTDVSALMRSVEASEQFEAPRLTGIDEIRGNIGADQAAFELIFSRSAANGRDR